MKKFVKSIKAYGLNLGLSESSSNKAFAWCVVIYSMLHPSQ